ncbi:MAG: hypothetical protein ACXABF_17025 [Candidatus Thorarchaeota archaeon]|jgi:hypothetical protein
MGLVDVIKVKLDRFDGESIGIITSTIYRRYDLSIDSYVWVVDVDLETAPGNPNDNGKFTLEGVVIDDPSRDVFSADIGTQVRLRRRPEDNRYTVVGLAKIAPGTLSICLVTLDPCGTTLTSIGDPVIFGFIFRLLTYDELGDPLLNGGFSYGQLPYGTSGKFDSNGNLITLITPTQ